MMVQDKRKEKWRELRGGRSGGVSGDGGDEKQESMNLKNNSKGGRPGGVFSPFTANRRFKINKKKLIILEFYLFIYFIKGYILLNYYEKVRLLGLPTFLSFAKLCSEAMFGYNNNIFFLPHLDVIIKGGKERIKAHNKLLYV